MACSNVSKPGFILEHNMHFVVANIVTPLTQSKGVSFVTLWGGRRVDYFVSLDHSSWQCFKTLFVSNSSNVCAVSVRSCSYMLLLRFVRLGLRSHSWGTSFPHFVHSIQCHALSKEGPTSWVDAAYWICSFATWLET